GTVLYQTATGKLPFDGPTSAVIFHGVLEKNPAPATDLNPMLPPQFADVIQKCLEKDPDLRCQSAAELRADLKRIKRGSNASSGRLSTASSSQQAEDTARLPSASTTLRETAPTRSRARARMFAAIAGPIVV